MPTLLDNLALTAAAAADFQANLITGGLYGLATGGAPLTQTAVQREEARAQGQDPSLASWAPQVLTNAQNTPAHAGTAKLGTAAANTANDAAKKAAEWGSWLPWVAGGLAVVGVAVAVYVYLPRARA